MNPKHDFSVTTHRLASLVALLSVVTGLLVLVGWSFNISVLKSLSPAWVAMKANTAVCFVLTGIALFLAASFGSQRPVALSLIAQLCSMLVGLLGVLTMSEYALDWNMGIDQWLFQEAAGTVGTSHSGRMAPDAALCFSMLAAALWLICSSFRKRWNIIASVSLGMLVLTLALTSMTSYLLQDSGIFGWFGFTHMAIHSAVLLVMLGSAVIAISWRAGVLSWSLQSRLTFFTLFILLLSLWSLTAFSSRMLYHDLQRQLSEQQLSTVSIMAADIDGELNDRLLALEDVSGGISPTTLGNAQAIQDYLEGLEILQRMFNGGVFATRVDGTATASVPLSARRVGVNYMERDHVKTAIREGKSTVSQPVLGKMLHSPVISMAVPIRDRQGRVIGSLVGVTDLNAPNFLDKVTENYYGKTGGYMLVAARYRMIVTATDKNSIMQPLPAAGVNPIIDRQVAGYEGSDIYFDESGQSVLASVKAIPAAAWYVLVSLPTQEAFASIYEMQKRMLSAALILAVLMIALTWWMLKRQMSPIFEAIETLASLANSDQTPQALPVVKQDEIGRLISGFNSLLKTLGLRESALRESENRYRSLADSGQALIRTSGTDKLSNDFNQVWLSFTGRAREQEMGNGWAMGIHPDDAQHFLEVYASAFDRREKFSLDYRLRRFDGEYRWVQDDGCPRYDSSGEFLGYISYCLDITERKNAEDQLRQLSLAVEQSSESVVITDINANIVYVNKAFVLATGYSHDEVTGQNSRMLHSGKTPPETYVDMWNTLKQGLAWKGMFYNRKKDGSEYIEFAIITPMRQPDGTISNYVAVKEDITERKKMGAELDRHRHHLEELVLQRTQELLAARQQADAANEAKSILLAVMHHEIRTPANIIIKLNQLMRRAGATPEQMVHLDEIDSAGRHLLAMINDIPDLNNTGWLNLENTDFSLMDILDDVMSVIGDAARNRGVRIEADAVDCRLLGDRARLSQAMLNYASNALRVIQTGSIFLRARVLEENDDELLVRFEVTDTGIEPDRIERLSRVFDQADTSRRAGETGSGLLVTRRLAQLMGGEVGVDSTPQTGSTLWFTARLRHGREIVTQTP
ncbi:MAG: PAS domain S-box protein [Gallionella sp.]|nr:PAS domain S-box protein [Gallionella sp.]